MSGDRGQAFTLEGLVGAAIVLTALLFALQALVITPTTGGAVDRTAQAGIQTETKDALVVAENDGDLSEMVRYWDEGEFKDGDQPRGEYNASRFGDRFTIGEILNERFLERGQNYNVELRYGDDGEVGNATLVYQGQPTASAVTASHTVTLYDDQRVTGGDDRTLAVADAAEVAPIPKDGDGELYNVVEVRVIVW